MNKNIGFIATVKLTTGEEVLAHVIETYEGGLEYFFMRNPITFREQSVMLDGKIGIALQPVKFLEFSTDDVVLIPKNQVVAMSELSKHGEDFYKKSVMLAKASSPIKKISDSKDNSAFIGNIEETRKTLEDLYKSNSEEDN
jgi:hypothetical protein